MEKNNNLKNEIISTKANTLKALEKIITKAFIEEMLIIVVEDYVKNKREVALNIGKKFKGSKNCCKKFIYKRGLLQKVQCRSLHQFVGCRFI